MALIRSISALAVCASPVLAQGGVPAPDYFVTAAMETSTAQALAQSCPTLSVHLGRMSGRTEMVLKRLSEDGFTPENLAARMQDPSETIAALQNAFLEKHNLRDGAPQAQVCAAGQAEIAEGTAIGALLIGEAQ